jgi:hypothetical protein
MRPEIDTEWIEYFRRSGFPAARGLSSRIESAVYAGEDRHFRWCVTMLKREDVRASIGL